MTGHESLESMTYAKAGVDIDAADQLVEKIKLISRKTHTPGVLSGIGSFGAMFEIPWADYKQPVLVSGTDGVGTKLKLANQLGQYHSIGIDLVAMCVNDILCHGAKPLFFLDYYASGKLHLDQAESIIASIGEGCEQAQCALIGGETAELPGMYHGDDYDLAGFCVGIVEKQQLIQPSMVTVGDVVIGLASSGPHSNGYSLIRYVLNETKADLDMELAGSTLSAALMAPTRIYVSAILKLLAQVEVHGLAHITGGGITDNLPRVLPDNVVAELKQSSWQWPEVFQWLQTRGNIVDTQMRRTFNLGVGMTVIVKPSEADKTLAILEQAGEQAWLLGEIQSSSGRARVVWV